MLGDRHEVEDAFQATFLVLAVRARSIRSRDSVASWLHGVALRVAASERSRAALRRRHDLARAAMNSSVTQEFTGDPLCNAESILRHPRGNRPPSREIPGGRRALLPRRTDPRNGRRAPRLAGGIREKPLSVGTTATPYAVDPAGVGPTLLPFDPADSSRDTESAQVLRAACIADKTLRGALLAGTDRGSLVGVSAEAVALMERAIKSMTNAKLTQVAAAALIAGLLTAGACVMGFPSAREKNPARSSVLGQEVRQGATAAPVVEGPSAPPPRNRPRFKAPSRCMWKSPIRRVGGSRGPMSR